MRWVSAGWLAIVLTTLVGLRAAGAGATITAVAGLTVTAVAALSLLLVPRAQRGVDPLPWRLSAGALAVFSAAEALALRDALAGGGQAYPAPADLLRLAGAAVLVAACAVVVRRRTPGRDWDSILDSTLVATGVAAVAWTVLGPWIGPQAVLATETRASAAAAPLLGLAFVLLALRLVTTVGLRVPAASGLLVGALGLLAASSWAVIDALDKGGKQPLHHLVLLASLGLITAASLDPSMRGIVGRLVAPDDVSHRERALLAGTGVLTTVACVGWGVYHGSLDARVAVAGIVALLLLGARVATGQELFQKALEREVALQSGSAALVAARTRSEVIKAAVATAEALTGGPRSAYVALELDRKPDLAITNAVVIGGNEGHAVALRGAIRRGGSLGRLGTAKTFVAPVVVAGRARGVLRVTGRRALPRDLYRAIGTLGSQFSLALESIERGEEVFEQRSEARFRSLVQSSRDLIAVLEEDLTIRYLTPSVREMLGTDPGELIGTNLTALLDPTEEKEVVSVLRNPPRHAMVLDDAFRLRRADGTWRTVEAVVNDLRNDPDVAGLVVTAHDITERRELEVQLTHQAFYDSLTGLPNRALLADRIDHALARARRAGDDIALLFLDVDDFKTVNDSLGHSAGDELLVEVAARLRKCVREVDTAARLGGDEFAILLEDPHGATGAATAASRILGEISRPVTIGTTEVHVRASIGIVVGPPDRSVGELLRSADVAMYQAKRDGGSRYEVFEPHMHQLATNRLALKADLETAFRNEQLDLAYQPLIEFGSGRAIGFEALLRWNHPVRGPVSPAEFVPLAEETGLINSIGEWVLRRACNQTRAWQTSLPGCDSLSANVNLSAKQILQRGFVATVDDALRESGLPAEDLVLEITEGTLLVDVEGVAARLAELRSRGVRIAIDDFGTGFSSLAYLQRFPLDELKIAREFVDGVVTDERRSRLVEAILTLARSLDLETIAEGIEERDQLERLEALGCNIGQGYLFSRPVPADQIPELLTRQLAAV